MARPLRIDNLRVVYGKAQAVSGVSLQVPTGTVRVLLGPNGAGKTSLLNGVCGLVRRAGGEVWLGDVPIHRRSPHQVARSGVIQVPEGRRIVANLTVEENLQLGRYAARGRERADAAYQDLDAIYELFPILRIRRQLGAGNLSGGEQQMLAIGRALMGQPEVMLLDEPSMGLAPTLVAQVLDCVARIASAGIGILMVEQNVAALDIASYGYVLEHGRVVAEGPASQLAGDSAVVDAYIGGASVREARGG